MVTFNKVNNNSDIDTVSRLAHEIWNQHFVSIIGQAQVDYMLEKFQSSDDIADQISGGYEYYIISNNDNNVGYLGLLPDINLSRIMISKFYIKSESRGLGFGSSTLNYVKQLAKDHQMKMVWLTVNKYNKETINWYLRKNFFITDEVKNDIGNDFFMDDYIMELEIV